MNRSESVKSTVVLATAFLLGGWMLPAHAYLDPGTGSLIIQGIIGAIAAAGVASRLYWYKIKAFFSGEKLEEPATEKPDLPES